MSLDGLRDAYIREKKSEIATTLVSRKRKLRELYHYTALLNAAHPPTPSDWDWASREPSDNERRFLDDNDAAKGRFFSDATLPSPFQHVSPPPTPSFLAPAQSTLPPLSTSSPSPAVPAALSLEEQLRAASASPSVANQPIPSTEVPPPPSTLSRVTQAPASASHAAPPGAPVVHPVKGEANIAPAEPHSPVPTQQPAATVVPDERTRAVTVPDGPSVDPQVAIPPTPEDAAALPEVSAPVTRGRRNKASQVVHLPSQEVQESRLRETERKLERIGEKERKEEERLALPTGNAPADLISSPSSTVGPYSQATPHAPHHSPDTSPETESFQDGLPSDAQNDVGLDPAAEQAKEEHERALQRQMQEARERARERSSDTPEIERQLEDEQAIRLARDGKSRLSESQPAPGPQALTEHAEEVVQVAAADAESEAREHIDDKVSQTPAADSLPTPTTTAPESSSLDLESSENVSTKAQKPMPALHDHPTPPADTDVDMGDTQNPDKAHKQLAQQVQAETPQRMTTRVSSGAIRRKSVSEIIGEKTAPKLTLTPRSSDISRPVTPPRPRSREHKINAVSTVVFAKQDANRASKALQLYNEDYASLQGASQDSSRDYLLGLFQYQAHHPPRSVPLQELIASARKTVSTAGTLATIREAQDYKILKRVYQLQNANRWSLRQLQKSAEPTRPETHLDHLLTEMKWMQTDFKEERKWKKALAATFAEWCAEYVNSTTQIRASLRVRARIPTPASIYEEDMKDAPTPELMHSGANETESESFADDDEILPSFGSNTPAGLFSLGFKDVVMKIDRTPACDAMIQELPTYAPSYNDTTPLSFCHPPILPVSKFVTGKLVSKVRGPPNKRSRFDYDSEDEPSSPPSRSGTSAEHSMPSTPGRRLFHRNDLPPEMSDVALFNAENKHVRDRLQAAHQFRPPSEFPMPSVPFFENRNSSQWLWDEDQKLRSLVKEYTFNWSLVAQELTLPSKFVSGSGRRTPWECFERWVQLEGLPAEMSKTQYFRTYQNRLEQAQRTVMAQHQAQQQLLQQQAQQGQNIAGQPRRRTTQPIRVERRRDNRHLAIIDGMRKLARKRESAAHKQAEAQKAAALRKAHEPAPPKSNVHTPQEFSRLKWEREEKMRQRQLQHDLSVRQAQMAAAMAQRQGSLQGQAGVPNGVNQPQRTATPTSANTNAPTQMATTNQQQGQPAPNGNLAARQMQTQQSLQGNFPNGNLAAMSMGMGATGIPQAQMQATMQNAQRMAPPDQMRLAMQKGQFPSTNQHAFQLQQQQINMASNLAASMGMGNGLPNANMIAQMGGQGISGNMNGNMNGNMAVSMNGSMNGMPGNAGSPRAVQQNVAMQNQTTRLANGQMPQLLQLQQNLKLQHPDWSPEVLQKHATDQLRVILQRRQQAMQSATGASGMNGSSQMGNNVYMQNGGMGTNSPSPNAVQNYQAQLVQQQRMMSQQRQQAGSPSMNNGRPASRSATPQNPQLQQSPGMQQAQVSRNQ